LLNISPGEIQHCENAQNFSKTLVTDWLKQYKFKFWNEHSDGRPVTEQEKEKRAEEIASALCNQGRWLTHGRSIKIDDLTQELRLQITDYSQTPDLADAINRYYILLQMSFDANNGIYKIYETPESQIYRTLNT
jgi:7-keto-8-aminopelargonate synthetase-like enzyme